MSDKTIPKIEYTPEEVEELEKMAESLVESLNTEVSK